MSIHIDIGHNGVLCGRARSHTHRLAKLGQRGAIQNIQTARASEHNLRFTILIEIKDRKTSTFAIFSSLCPREYLFNVSGLCVIGR